MTKFGDLDAGGTLLRAEELLSERRGFEVSDLDVALHWADLHAADPRAKPPEERRPGMPRLVQVGGQGSPMVQDLAMAELAIARQTHTLATRWLLADGLDLRHRLPKCNRVVHDLACEFWVARRIAKATRHLSQAEAAYVDAALAPALAGEQPGRILELLEAKIIEANPAAHEERTSAERARRYVSVGRVDAAGLRHVIARVEHGDAVWVDALIGRIAQILADQDRAAGKTVRDRDLLRSVAFGWLARPAELLALLLEHASDPDPEGQVEPEGGVPPVPDPGDDNSADGGSAGTDRADAPGEGWVAGFPQRLLGVLQRINPARLRSQAVVYLHLHAATIGGIEALQDANDVTNPTAIPVVARLENGGGPRLPAQLVELLGDAHVTVKPVIDLRDRVSVNSYEMPQWLRERVHLTSPREVFPHSTMVSRSVDMDHPVPYRHPRPGEPAEPGQSGTHNSAPLGRRAHRTKTFLPYQLREPRPGTYVWRTPHGRWLLVDDTGTHHIDEELGRALTEGSPMECELVAMIHQHGKNTDPADE